MKINRIIAGIIILAIAGIIVYSLQGSQSGEGYLEEVKQHREEKDKLMVSEGNPFASSPTAFTGLKYFEPNPEFRISATLKPIRDKKVVTLSTNDGLENRYLEYGYAEFAISGEKCKLLILELMEAGPNRGTLFLAFADATSASETYGAGRYLDIKKVPGSTSVLLDFNKAYNPYCAYSDNYSCPFPPRENVLAVGIEAGEKIYSK
jgi:hypothetical protein